MRIEHEALASYLRKGIKALALIEAVEGVVYLGLAGWGSANAILVALAVLGVLGAAVVWLSRGMGFVWLGALLVVAAPSVVYPLSALLLLCVAASATVAGVERHRRSHLVPLS